MDVVVQLFCFCSIIEVKQHPTRLILGWVTAFCSPLLPTNCYFCLFVCFCCCFFLLFVCLFVFFCLLFTECGICIKTDKRENESKIFTEAVIIFSHRNGWLTRHHFYCRVYKIFVYQNVSNEKKKKQNSDGRRCSVFITILISIITIIVIYFMLLTVYMHLNRQR